MSVVVELGGEKLQTTQIRLEFKRKTYHPIYHNEFRVLISVRTLCTEEWLSRDSKISNKVMLWMNNVTNLYKTYTESL